MKYIVFIILAVLPLCTKGQALREALAAKDTVLAARLIANGADPNAPDNTGATLLMQACHFPDLPTASFLLRHGARADAPRSTKGRTALMVACAYWCGLDMVKLLVVYGADVNAAAYDGTTPLMLAAQNEKQDVVDYLLRKGANAKAHDDKGRTALDYARTGDVDAYMTKSVKDTRFDKQAVLGTLMAKMK